MRSKKFFALSLLSLLIYVSDALSHSFIVFTHWNGQEYHQNAQLQETWADRLFFKHYHFTGNEIVLDIGSGDGKITSRIANAIPQGKILAIDNSDSMMDEALKHYSDRPNLAFVLQDAQDPKFYKKYPTQFDIVVSFTVLHWVNDQATVLKGIHHVLKPNGKFYLRICSKGGDPMQDIADNLKDHAKYKSHFKYFKDPMHRFSEQEYAALIKQANLNVISIKDTEEQDTLVGKEKLTKQIKSWLPHYHYLKKATPLVAEKFMTEVIDTYLKKFPQKPDGTIVLYDHYLDIVGAKKGDNLGYLSSEEHPVLT